MKPLFGGLLLIFTFFFKEIEASGNGLSKIKTKYTAEAATPDDVARIADRRSIMNLGTPARGKKPQAPPPPQWDGHELARSLARTGGAAHDVFVDYYREKSLTGPRMDEYRRRAREPSVQQHQEMYQQHTDFQDPGSMEKSKITRKFKGKNTHNMFLDRNRKRGLSNIPVAAQQHQDFQDHSGGSGFSLRGAGHRYQTQYSNVGDQSRGSGSFSGNNHPRATLSRSPWDDSYSHLDVQPPQYHLNYNLEWVPDDSLASGGNTGGNHQF